MAGTRGSGYTMPWLKLYSRKWLSGSIRMQLSPAERGIWADLLAMASESSVRGTVCASKNLPYTREYLAHTLVVNIDELNSTIEKCCKDKNSDNEECRMKVDEFGCLVITNFGRYQDTPADKLRETNEEKAHREQLLQSKLNRKYPQSAGLKVTETLTVDGKTGEILKTEQHLQDQAAIPPSAAT